MFNPFSGVFERIRTRLLVLVGHAQTINSQAYTILEKDTSGNVTKCSGAFAPTDGGSGFAKGCKHLRTDGSAGTTWYVNEGTSSSCDFNAVESAAAGITAVVAGDGIDGGATEGSATVSVDVTDIAGSGLKDDGSNNLTVEPADFAGDGLQDDGSDNLAVDVSDFAGAGLEDDGSENLRVKAEVRTEIVPVGLPGTVASASFPFDVETVTEQAAALAVVHDESDTDYLLSAASGGGGITSDYQMFPDVPAENDAVYFGGAAPFGVISIDVDTVATYGADSLAWEYWNGSAWTALTIVWDETDTTANDGLRSFQQDGVIIFSAPTDWASTSVNGQAGYWVRARANATVNITQVPITNSVEHGLVTCATAAEMPAAGTIGRGRLTWVTPSGANNDTIVILVNLTKGTCSALTTLTQALSAHEVADFNVACDADDQVALYVTQEDGTTEFANGLMTLSLVKTG